MVGLYFWPFPKKCCHVYLSCCGGCPSHLIFTQGWAVDDVDDDIDETAITAMTVMKTTTTKVTFRVSKGN